MPVLRLSDAVCDQLFVCRGDIAALFALSTAPTGWVEAFSS
jgi:hypothetical protein